MKCLRCANTAEVFAYEKDGSQDHLIAEELALMAPVEVEAHLYPMKQPIPADVDAERDRRMDSGVEFEGTLFQSRSADREGIFGAAQLAFIAMAGGTKVGDLRWSKPSQDFVWITADNSLVPMDAPIVVAFGKTVIARKQSLIHAGRQLKDMEVIPSDYIHDKWWS
ncbi:DUF4376 domain-containing protein [Aquipseudomonas alcaligenes]